MPNSEKIRIGLLAAVAMTIGLTAIPAFAAPPVVLDPVTLDFDGGEIVGTAPSFGDVKRSSKKGLVQVEIVVRDMPLSVPAAQTLDPTNVCFSEPDDGNGTPDTAGAAGKLTLRSDGSAAFDLYANFETVDGDLQSYNFYLDSPAGAQHMINLSANLIAGSVDFSQMNVDTEGRGKKPASCRGTVELSFTSVLISSP